jgi:hypothetical protein
VNVGYRFGEAELVSPSNRAQIPGSPSTTPETLFASMNSSPKQARISCAVAGNGGNAAIDCAIFLAEAIVSEVVIVSH